MKMRDWTEIDHIITQGREDLRIFLGDLIRFATVNPPGREYEACTAYLAEALSTLGLESQVLTVPLEVGCQHLPDHDRYPRSNVLAFLEAGQPTTVHINAHYDVVPASPSWSGDPFALRETGAGWVGRGVADMKGAIAAFWLALRSVLASGHQPAHNLEISFTADEETDSELGLAWLLRSHRSKADRALILEGGSGLQLGIGHNGVLWLEVEVIGRAAHGSEPHLGVNAIEAMAIVVNSLQDYKTSLKNISYQDPEGRTRVPTLNVAGSLTPDPGAKINTVPASVGFTLDRRILPNESLEQVEAELRAFLTQIEGLPEGASLRVRKLSAQRPTLVDPQLPHVSDVKEAIRSVRGKPVGCMVSHGFNDSHFFAEIAGIPAVGYGPAGINYHADNEAIDPEELLTVARVYARYLLGLPRE